MIDDNKKQAWIKEARKDGLKGTDSKMVLNLVLSKFIKLFREEIWKPWCKKTIAWESIQDITNKSKKGKPGKRQPENRSKKDNSSKNKEDSRSKKRVSEIVWDWIKEGKKWLSF